MSNESFAYESPYSSVRSHWQTPQSAQPEGYQAQNVSSSSPYYGPQTTAAIGTYGASDYQSHRCTQHQQINSGIYFSWNGSSMGDDGARQRLERRKRDDIREAQPEGNSRSGSQIIYDGSSNGSYGYSSTLNYSAGQSITHEGRLGFPSHGVNADGSSNEDVNIRIPYQPCSRSFENPNIVNPGSNSSQRESGHAENGGAAGHASGIESYKPPIQIAINPKATAGLHSSYLPNTAVPWSNAVSSSNTLGNVESAIRQKTQDSFLPTNDFVRSQSSAVQTRQDQQNQSIPSRHPVAGVRKFPNAVKLTQSQRTEIPPSSLTHPPGISLIYENITRSKEPTHVNSLSAPRNIVDSIQPIHQPMPGPRPNNSQTPEDQSVHALTSEYRVASSALRLQARNGSLSTIPKAPTVNLRVPSPNVPATVDPSHVYNRYHEYQKQIEDADAEHARLAALKAEREAAEAAAAALVSAKALSQTMDSARLQLENQRANEIRENLEMLNHPVSNSPTLPNIPFTGQASNRKVRETPQTVPGPQKEPPTVDPQRVAAMEEEMCFMVEKMREFQSRDPQLFAHVWESVKGRKAPRPMQAQTPAREDLIRTSVESQNERVADPVSSTVQNVSQLAARFELIEGTGMPAKPPRKRKSRSKAVIAEQASESSKRFKAQQGKRADVGTDIVPKGNRNSTSILSPQEMQNKLPQAYRELPDNFSILAQHTTTSTMDYTDTPSPAQNHLTSDGVSNHTRKADALISKANQKTSTDINSLGPVPLRESSQMAQSTVDTISRNASSGLPIGQYTTQNSLTTNEKKKSGVLWPEKYRDAIANTAEKVLIAIPENAGKKISAFQILDMLGYNPNYIELCELIEGIGFKLDRARFVEELLAAVPGINSAPAQPAESKTSQLPIDLATPKEYQAVTGDPFNVAPGSPNTERGHTTHVQAQNLPVEAVTASIATSHSQNKFDDVPRSSGGPGSRGPYRKTRERMTATQYHSPSSGKRRGRPRKLGSPRMTPVSNNAVDRNNPIDPSLLNERSSIISDLQKAPVQVPLAAASSKTSGNIEERLLLALEGGVSSKKNALSSGSQPVLTHPVGLFTGSSKLQAQNSLAVGQSITGWRQYALSHPPPGLVGKDENSCPKVKTSHTVTPTPLTKEMAARKRTFAEIVDLTLHDATLPIEDKSLTAGKVRHVGSTNFERADHYDAAQEPNPPNDSLEHQQPQPTATTTTPLPKLPESQIALPSGDAVILLAPNPYKDFNDIVKPINRSIALRKSRYDPKTIARDILITTGRHPFQRGLNAHLEPLKARFTKVDDSSDLSTFRWDIVDPGGASVGLANMSTTSGEIRNRLPIDNGGKSSGRVNLDQIELLVHRGPLRPTRGVGSSRGRGRGGLTGTQARQPTVPSGLRYSSTADSKFAVIIEPTASHISHDIVASDKGGHKSSSPARRRGRPPKSLAAASQPITPLRKRIGRPPKHPSRGNSMRGISSGRQVGRVRTNSLSKSKPTGRQRKSDSKSATPKFIPFLCEWKNCKAELHNLDTLRRHVYSVHNKVLASGGIACQWSKCGLTRQVHDETTPKSTPKSTPEPKFIHEYHEFGDMQLFTNHVERAHLVPFAWHMGDGPRGSTFDGSESGASAYLSDAQITPSTGLPVEDGKSSQIYKSRRVTERPYDPALESPVELATPEMKAKFSMGTEWKKIEAPPRD